MLFHILREKNCRFTQFYFAVSTSSCDYEDNEDEICLNDCLRRNNLCLTKCCGQLTECDMTNCATDWDCAYGYKRQYHENGKLGKCVPDDECKCPDANDCPKKEDYDGIP